VCGFEDRMEIAAENIHCNEETESKLPVSGTDFVYSFSSCKLSSEEQSSNSFNHCDDDEPKIKLKKGCSKKAKMSHAVRNKQLVEIYRKVVLLLLKTQIAVMLKRLVMHKKGKNVK
jgi:hypothetical protein